MKKYKDFDDFWERSGILETDAFLAIMEECGFTKDNVPQALKSWARTIWALSGEAAETEARLKRKGIFKILFKKHGKSKN